jgi:hypothetical protein
MDKEDFAVIFEHINNFINSEKESYMIPFELTNKERSNVHDYIRTKTTGIVSESVRMKGSANKKIRIDRINLDSCSNRNIDGNSNTLSDSISHYDLESETNKIRLPTDDEINIFCTHAAPISCSFSEYIEYFVKLYDPLYGTVSKWRLFMREIQTMSLKKELDNTMRQISSNITNNIEYQTMIKTNIKGPTGKIDRDVYKISNIGKFFVSFDIKEGQVTVLRDKCKSIFQNENGEQLSWYQYVKQFTKSDFIAESKYFREVCFGNAGFAKRANTLQEIYMHDMHQIILAWAKDTNVNMILRMKAGDENVYELENYVEFVSRMDSLKNVLGSHTNNLHIRVFKVDQIETKIYFLKTFLYNTDWVNTDGSLKPEVKNSLKSKIEFKYVPKGFMPQVIKWYNNEEIKEKDLIFTDNGIPSKYLATIFE